MLIDQTLGAIFKLGVIYQGYGTTLIYVTLGFNLLSVLTHIIQTSYVRTKTLGVLPLLPMLVTYRTLNAAFYIAFLWMIYLRHPISAGPVVVGLNILNYCMFGIVKRKLTAYLFSMRGVQPDSYTVTEFVNLGVNKYIFFYLDEYIMDNQYCKNFWCCCCCLPLTFFPLIFPFIATTVLYYIMDEEEYNWVYSVTFIIGLTTVICAALTFWISSFYRNLKGVPAEEQE